MTMKFSILPLSFMVFLMTCSNLGLAIEMSELEFASLKASAEIEISNYREQSVQNQLNVSHLSVDSTRMTPESAGVEKRIAAPQGISTQVFNRIQAEADPALQEAMLDRWLSNIAQKASSTADEIQALETIRHKSPVVLIPHHEMVHHTMPAFNIGLRARNLLQLRERQTQARQLSNDFEQLVQAFSSEAGSEDFLAAEIASRAIPELQKSRLIEHFQRQLPQNPEAASALISIADSARLSQETMADVIRLGDLSSARQALRMNMGNVDRRALAEQALARPEIGGLAIQAWLESGGDADARFWSLLADLDLGADAARALAEHSTQLTEKIESEIHQAAPVARLRMLLALKLRNSPDSKALLNRLLDAEWLSPQQRMEVASWL